MATRNDNRNSFMDSPEAQVAMYCVCVAFCVFYAVGAVRDLISPTANEQLVASIGEGGFLALTITRLVVCIVTGAAFGRLALKIHRKRREK